jgi:hypothetical protein
MSVLAATALYGTANADVVTAINPNGTLLLGFGTSTSTPNSGAPATVTGNPNSSTLPIQVNDLTNNPASNYNFFNSYSLPTTASYSGTLNGYSYNFDDNYIIDVPAAESSAYIFSLNFTQQLGIQNLTARLYAYNAGGVQNVVVGGTGPVTGAVSGPWSPDQNGVISSTTLSADVPPGEYVLQVVGLQTGTVSGMYNGSLAITPVPVPAGLPLLLSGLGGMAFLRRRRR